MDIERLEKIGLKKASNRITELRGMRRKMTIAYEHFRYVKQEKIDAFNKRLKDETLREDKKAHYYKCLQFISLEEYTEVPPEHVLDALEKAQEMNCFDTFEVAKIQDKVEIKDPIVFGRIKNCPDRFYISQWDDDVKIEQILNENEG